MGITSELGGWFTKDELDEHLIVVGSACETYVLIDIARRAGESRERGDDKTWVSHKELNLLTSLVNAQIKRYITLNGEVGWEIHYGNYCFVHVCFGSESALADPYCKTTTAH